MRLWILRALHCTLTVLVFAYAHPVLAVEILGQSRTYLQSRETTDSKNHLPFYEYLNFEANSLGFENVSFHFGGWLRYDFQEETFGKRSNSDLQYAYLSIRREKGNGLLNVGRMFVREGVAAQQIDGAYARTDLKGGFGIAAFGGIPVETDFDNRGGDSVFGGRLSHGIPNLYLLGVSYLKEENGKVGYREETGADLWLRPTEKVELNGLSSYNAITYGWKEHTYSLSLGPFKNVRIIGNISNITYRDFFTPSTTTAFKFDPTIIDPNERSTAIGGTIAYSSQLPIPLGVLTASADYKRYSYSIAGNASYFGGKLSYGISKMFNLGLAIHRMDGQTERLKYSEYLLYALRKFGPVDITGTMFMVFYDNEINGIKDAYSFVLAGGYQVSQNLRVALDLEYMKNPSFDKDFRGLFKIVYNFNAVVGGKRGK